LKIAQMKKWRRGRKKKRKNQQCPKDQTELPADAVENRTKAADQKPPQPPTGFKARKTQTHPQRIEKTAKKNVSGAGLPKKAKTARNRAASKRNGKGRLKEIESQCVKKEPKKIWSGWWVLGEPRPPGGEKKKKRGLGAW